MLGMAENCPSIGAAQGRRWHRPWFSETLKKICCLQFEFVSTLLVKVSKQSMRENNSQKPLASCSSECQEVRHKVFKLHNKEKRMKAWPWYFEVILVVNDQCSSCALLGGGKILWKDAEEMLSRIPVTFLDFKLVTWFSFSFLEGVVSIWSPKWLQPFGLLSSALWALGLQTRATTDSTTFWIRSYWYFACFSLRPCQVGRAWMT